MAQGHHHHLLSEPCGTFCGFLQAGEKTLLWSCWCHQQSWQGMAAARNNSCLRLWLQSLRHECQAQLQMFIAREQWISLNIIRQGREEKGSSVPLAASLTLIAAPCMFPGMNFVASCSFRQVALSRKPLTKPWESHLQEQKVQPLMLCSQPEAHAELIPNLIKAPLNPPVKRAAEDGCGSSVLSSATSAKGLQSASREGCGQPFPA